MKKYTTQQIQAGIKFLQNKNVDFDFDKDDMLVQININVHNNRIWTSGDSIWNKDVVKGVKVDYMSLIATYEDWDDAYWSGGLAGNIVYDGSGKDGTWYDGSDGLIYTDGGFIDNSIKYMEQHCDFDSKLLSDFLAFDYSEQGMQENERVNLDVQMDGDFWIKCNDELVKFVNTKVA